MSRKFKITFWILILAIGVLALLFSFSPTQPVSAQVVSPEVGDDGWVTFRYYDPTATSVQLYGEWGRNYLGALCYSLETFSWPILDMTMDGDGVWSYTIQLEPNFYNYHFIVDGAAVLDPSNPPWHPDANNNQVYIPSPDYEWVAVQDVSHGELREEFYYSDVTDSMRPYAVYLPPDYDKNSRKFPLLILSHGGYGNHIDWSTQGLANNILDNLIAEHKIRPMVVVMTNFYPLFDFGIPADFYRNDLLDNVIPDVEAKFRVMKNPQQRGFAGLSMGGYLAGDILANTPEEFGFIGVWSGWALSYIDFESNIDAIEEMRGIDISVGGLDFLYNDSVYLMDVLDANDVPYTGLVTPGDCHTWYFWRDALYEFLTGPFLEGNQHQNR